VLCSVVMHPGSYVASWVLYNFICSLVDAVCLSFCWPWLGNQSFCIWGVRQGDCIVSLGFYPRGIDWVLLYKDSPEGKKEYMCSYILINRWKALTLQRKRDRNGANHRNTCMSVYGGQFHMRCQIPDFEEELHVKLYPVLHCGQVKVYRKINFSSLVTIMYSGGKVSNCFLYSKQ